jgi:carboxylesterase type B
MGNGEGVIFVSINYRLGLFGWLGAGGITPNLGLYDQRIALEWVQKYIGRFGGSSSRVTAIGESAGATSVLHHITSYGGEGSAPFAQGITQSPAFQFNLNLTDAYEATLAEATNSTGRDISNASELASLDSETLKAINFGAVKVAPKGEFTYGPAPDGTYVPALPQVLLAQGKFHSDVKVMAAHNSLEAAPFVPTTIESEADLVEALTASFPEVANLTYILDTLYPADSYPSQFLRAVQIIGDVDFSCTTRYLALALQNQTHNYIFAVPPGYHAQDTAYTFFNGDTSTLNDGTAVDPALAAALQDYIVGFAATGVPADNPAGTAPDFPIYGEDATVVEITAGGVIIGKDDMANERCAWWQQAMIEGIA